MLFNRKKQVSKRLVTTTSFLISTILTGAALAETPELFRPDPTLLEDHSLNIPRTGKSGFFQYEIIQGFAIFEGDIMLGRVDQTGSLTRSISSRGLGRSDAFGRWPDGIIPYMSTENNSAIQQERIVQALEHWTELTSLSFVERTRENQDDYPNYIRFESTNSCASYVGMQGGEQPILVSDACSMGSIVHEIGHAIGLFHEHTRPDRENFAQVDWDQIVSGKEINFDVLDAGVENFGEYDYGSIMHYGEYFFSATGEPTIIVPDGITIGQRRALSDLDIQSVNKMYATDIALLQPTVNEVDSGLEIGISIANQGEQGAQDLVLVANVSSDSIWRGISEDSDWDCATVASELRCTLPTLTEYSETRFTVLVEPGSGDESDIGMSVTSRTIDADPSNNSFNHSGIEEEAIEPVSLFIAPEPSDSEPLQEVETTTPEPEPAPVLGPARPAPDATPVIAPATAAGAGSENGVLISLTMLALLWGRRRGDEEDVVHECAKEN